MKKIKIRNKAFLYHLIFWLGFWLLNVLQEDEGESLNEILAFSSIFLIVIATIVTVNTKVLIPRFLYKGKYLVYIASLLLVISPFLMILYVFEEIPISQIIPEVIENLIYIAGLSSIWLIIDQSRLREELAQKENERISANLKYLKAQTNPHFLFNVLNNINFLIEKDAEKAQEVLQVLSDLLRYQLYDTNTEKVSLDREINHLKNYLELEKIRMGDRLQLNATFPSERSDLNIAPFLLLPLVENSFKHGTSAEQCLININCSLNNKQLILEVTNPIGSIDMDKKSGGIGIQNLKQRLELIYPKRYQYEYKEEDDSFKVYLKIEL